MEEGHSYVRVRIHYDLDFTAFTLTVLSSKLIFCFTPGFVTKMYAFLILCRHKCTILLISVKNVKLGFVGLTQMVVSMPLLSSRWHHCTRKHFRSLVGILNTEA